MDRETQATVRRFADWRWNEVPLHPYKEDGAAPFRAITRQTLFNDPGFACELRYFEMAAGGHSSLERHGHMHAVLILRGEGHCLLGETVFAVRQNDLVTIPPWVWHQFRATAGAPMGFLCMVNQARDKPVLPSDEELAAMRRNPTVAAFLDG
ncbi:MAG: cupin domain-containing protein [Acetobacteraceae bacterium]|nr:cupin domain-containing protein [Acetobacteraceae bacterium]